MLRDHPTGKLHGTIRAYCRTGNLFRLSLGASGPLSQRLIPAHATESVANTATISSYHLHVLAARPAICYVRVAIFPSTRGARHPKPVSMQVIPGLWSSSLLGSNQRMAVAVSCRTDATLNNLMEY
jgi:hypothetical protein